MAFNLLRFNNSFKASGFKNSSVNDFFQDNVLSVEVTKVTIQPPAPTRQKGRLTNASRKGKSGFFKTTGPRKASGKEGKPKSKRSLAALSEGFGSKSLRNINSARKNVARKLSNISFMGFQSDKPIFQVEVNGRKGKYTIEKEYKHFKRLHDGLKSKFPEVKRIYPAVPKIKMFASIEPTQLEEHRQFFQKYLDTLIKLQPRPADLNKFLEILDHAQELKGKTRNGFNTLDDFELVRRIGEGSFGKVYLVRAIETDEIFAMKVLKKEDLRKKHQVEHTLTEMRVMSVSEHPFIVALKFAFHTEDMLFMVTQYCPGGELFYHLKQMRKLSEETVRFYSAEIALALGYLHGKNVLYRDLKPENILLDAEGHVLLTDFGLSRENCLTNKDAKTFCGTPEYLSPEMLIHRETREGYGKGVDWWSLGILVFEMLYGLPPFYHKNLKKMCERILHRTLTFPDKKTNVFPSDDAKDLVRGLLDRNVQHRLGVFGEGFEEVKSHPFFSSIDWAKLREKKYTPPYKPEISDDRFNVSNFDKEFTSKPAKLSIDGSMKAKSKGKSFANKSINDLEDEFEDFDYNCHEKTQKETIENFYGE